MFPSRSQSFDAFKTEFCHNASSLADVRNKLKMHLVHKDDSDKKICVFFADDEKIGVKTVKEFADFMTEDKVFLILCACTSLYFM